MREFLSIIILMPAIICLIAFVGILFSKDKDKLKRWFTATIILFVLYFIVSPKATSNIVNEEKQDGQKNVNQAVVSSNTGNSTSLVNQKIEQSLFNSTEEFTNAFNQYSASHELDFRINSLKIVQGEVYNSFIYVLNDNLVLGGSIIKSNGGVKKVTMIGTGDGTITSANNMLFCMIAIIATVDPTIPAESRGKILKKLKIFGDKSVDITHMSQATIMNGIKYSIYSNPLTGLEFDASTDTDSD